MQIPENLKYTKDHEWILLEGQVATVGITEFAQSELGDIVFVDLPAAGKVVRESDSLCVVESTKAASDVYAPIGGAVQESNQLLAATPEMINKAPYAQGWLVKLKDIDPADAAKLMSAAEYKKFLGEKAA